MWFDCFEYDFLFWMWFLASGDYIGAIFLDVEHSMRKVSVWTDAKMCRNKIKKELSRAECLDCFHGHVMSNQNIMVSKNKFQSESEKKLFLTFDFSCVTGQLGRYGWLSQGAALESMLRSCTWKTLDECCDKLVNYAFWNHEALFGEWTFFCCCEIAIIPVRIMLVSTVARDNSRRFDL